MLRLFFISTVLRLFFILMLICISHAQCPLNTRIVPGQTVCTACETGTVSPGGNIISCTRCPAGYRAGRGVCEPCGPGTYSTALSDACLLCPSGTVAPNSAATDCTPCPVDQLAVGPIECKSCPLGHQLGNDSLSCVPCPPGHARQAFDARCVQCLPGSYSEFPGSIQCSICSTGKVSPSNAALTCDPCPAGFTSTPGLNSTCTPCPEGMTSSGQGGECIASTPQEAPTDQYKLSEGSVIAYSYTLGTILLLIATGAFVGQRWYDRLLAKQESVLV